jgi:hypothetical protein
MLFLGIALPILISIILFVLLMLNLWELLSIQVKVIQNKCIFVHLV